MFPAVIRKVIDDARAPRTTVMFGAFTLLKRELKANYGYNVASMAIVCSATRTLCPTGKRCAAESGEKSPERQ